MLFPITITFSYCIFQSSVQSFLINNAQTISANAKADPAILLYIVELLVKQVQSKVLFVLLFECETLLPIMAFFPVI